MYQKRVLITGASGSVGIEILKILGQSSTELKIRLFDRETRKTRRKLKSHQSFEWIKGDLTKVEQVEEACQGCDAVIHLGALIPPVADKNPSLAEKINIQGTQNIIKALKETNPQAFLIYASSISVYGDRTENPWIEATDPIIPSEGDYYAKTKIAAEELLRASALRWTILRLTAVMGEQTRMSSLFFHMPLHTSLEIITAHDAASAFLSALHHQEELTGQTFNLSGGPACRTNYRDFLNRVFQIMGLEKLIFPPTAFAERNFHCGYYRDEYKLQQILHFQEQGLEDYYRNLEDQQSFIKIKLAKFFQPFIKWMLLNKSDPYRAFRKGRGVLFRRFFSISE